MLPNNTFVLHLLFLHLLHALLLQYHLDLLHRIVNALLSCNIKLSHLGIVGCIFGHLGLIFTAPLYVFVLSPKLMPLDIMRSLGVLSKCIILVPVSACCLPLGYCYTKNSPILPSPFKIQLDHFHVIALPVSTWVQDTLLFFPSHLGSFGLGSCKHRLLRFHHLGCNFVLEYFISALSKVTNSTQGHVVYSHHMLGQYNLLSNP